MLVYIPLLIFTTLLAPGFAQKYLGENCAIHICRSRKWDCSPQEMTTYTQGFCDQANFRFEVAAMNWRHLDDSIYTPDEKDRIFYCDWGAGMARFRIPSGIALIIGKARVESSSAPQVWIGYLAEGLRIGNDRRIRDRDMLNICIGLVKPSGT
jgi:hypothetical protein